MVPPPEYHPEKPEYSILLGSLDLVKRLDSQIRKISEVTQEANQELLSGDRLLTNHLQEIKITASAIIDQFKVQKKIILQHFDQWIIPIAQGILDGFIDEAQRLKDKLEDRLTHLDQLNIENWDTEINLWMQLYLKWNDRKELIHKIIEIIDDRTTHLIDRDIQVIHDYRNQSLSHLSQKTEVFRGVEERLAHAIEEPLKQLMSLRDQVKEHTSLQQVSEWVANLQERREGYFDQLLMKIDHVMKDVVELEEAIDWTVFVEEEGEILFMEQELEQIYSGLTHICFIDEPDRQFLIAGLQGLLEHATELDKRTLPSFLQVRMENLKSGITSAICRLNQ